ncbi:GNAT family N-acetyltransferase [Geodermatophilus sp. SYSU D00691]
MSAFAIRDASPDDGAACAAVYAPYVADTVITFEYEPPTATEMSARIARARQAHAWLVLEDGGRVAGFAYGVPWNERAAYRWACAVSVYLEPGRRRTGAGRALYEALFDRLVARGYRTAVAGVTLPNPASEGLHRALGFEPVGTYRAIGWKLSGWHDVTWLQKSLTDGEDPPAEPR